MAGAGAADVFQISAIRAQQRGTPADDGHCGSSSGSFVRGSPGKCDGFVEGASPESCGDSTTPTGGGDHWRSACLSIARTDTSGRTAAGVSSKSAARIIQVRGSCALQVQALLLLLHRVQPHGAAQHVLTQELQAEKVHIQYYVGFRDVLVLSASWGSLLPCPLLS